MIIKVHAQSEDKILIRHKGNVLAKNKLIKITENFYIPMNLLIGKYIVQEFGLEFGLELYNSFRERFSVYILETHLNLRDIKLHGYKII